MSMFGWFKKDSTAPAAPPSSGANMAQQGVQPATTTTTQPIDENAQKALSDKKKAEKVAHLNSAMKQLEKVGEKNGIPNTAPPIDTGMDNSMMDRLTGFAQRYNSNQGAYGDGHTMTMQNGMANIYGPDGSLAASAPLNASSGSQLLALADQMDSQEAKRKGIV